MNYAIHILIMIGIYSLVAYSLNLLIGYGGILTLASAAFYGIGAYTYTLLSVNYHLSFVYAVIASIIFTGIMAYLVGMPALKFRGNLFVIVTLGFQVIIYTILYNWVGLTRGPYGIPGIPRPLITLKPIGGKGIAISSLPDYLILVIVLNIIVLLFLFLVYKSPYGLSLKSLREDELAATALGKPAFLHYHRAFVISSALLAVPGAIYASYVTYIDPTSFTIDESIFQVIILVIGGAGNIKGPITGVLFMILLPELLRFLGMPDTIAANMRQIIYGLIVILLVYFRPQGILGEHKIR